MDFNCNSQEHIAERWITAKHLKIFLKTFLNLTLQDCCLPHLTTVLSLRNLCSWCVFKFLKPQVPGYQRYWSFFFFFFFQKGLVRLKQGQSLSLNESCLSHSATVSNTRGYDSLHQCKFFRRSCQRGALPVDNNHMHPFTGALGFWITGRPCTGCSWGSGTCWCQHSPPQLWNVMIIPFFCCFVAAREAK